MEARKVTTEETKEIETAERCHILELLNTSDDRSQSIARARVEPGVTTAWHRLKNTTEVYYILSGEGEAEVEGQRYNLSSNELLRIPAGAAQRITNTGKDDLLFLCFCKPAFDADCYEDLEH